MRRDPALKFRNLIFRTPHALSSTRARWASLGARAASPSLLVGLTLSSMLLVGHAWARTEARSITTSIPAGVHPAAIAIDSATGKVYVANHGSGDVTIIDERSGVTERVAAGSGPAAVAANEWTSQVYVANSGSGDVSVIDGRTNRVHTVKTGSRPLAIAIDTNTNRIYVANSGDDTVSVIDGETNEVIAQVKVGHGPAAIAIDSATSAVFVANSQESSVTMIDEPNHSTRRFETGTMPSALAVDQDARRVYVANSGSDTVSVIDEVAGTTNQISVGPRPAAVGVDPVTHRAYILNHDNDTVAVIESRGDSAHSIEVGLSPAALAFDPQAGKVYIANSLTNNVSSITLETGAREIIDLTPGKDPVALAVSTATHKVYTANRDSNDVTVIDEAEHDANTRGSRAVHARPFDNWNMPFQWAFRGVKEKVEAWVEFDITTCETVSTGNYKVVSKPKHGTLSYGVKLEPLDGGTCPGKLFAYNVVYYTWTDTKANVAQDTFAVNWSTSDGAHNVTQTFTGYLAPFVSGPSQVWWFGGAKPPAYSTEIQLYAGPSGFGPYDWKVTDGEKDVKLVKGSYPNEIQVEGTEMSPGTDKGGKKGNVLVTVSAEAYGVRSGPSNPWPLTVLAPYRAEALPIPLDQPKPNPKGRDSCDVTMNEYWWYVSTLPYKVLDQFGTQLTGNLPVREHFLTDPKDYPTSNWIRTAEDGGDSPNGGIIKDTIQGQPNFVNSFCTAKANPPALCPSNDCDKPSVGYRSLVLQCWNGEVWVGSTDFGPGKGLKIMTLTWERFLDHARHCAIESPPGSGHPINKCDCP